MREAHPLERAVGIGYYVSDVAGTGGRLRVDPADFRVREVEAASPAPLEADVGDYPHLLVRATLRGWDTNDFAKRLSDALGASRERVSWAGTKDKHAVTTQLFTIRGVSPADLPQIRDVEIEPLGRLGRALRFGDLLGNEFRIRVREADHPDRADAVTAALHDFGGGEAPASVGVPNVFGNQRFGSRRPVTHRVGESVVRGEWREAVLAYLGSPTEHEPAATRTARRVVDEEAARDEPDWGRALEAMPRYLGFERSMLHRLVESGGETGADFRRALEAVPANLQRMFVNAFQSFLFNRMLSRRLERGLPFDRAVPGDVVCFADRDVDAPDGLALPDTDRTQAVTEARVDVVARHCERGRAFVTAPLVGTETTLADGDQGEIERAVLSAAGVEPGDFDLPGAFGSTGTRRAILVRTDVDVERTDDGYAASFALPRGAYATALMREYLKASPLEL
jgi:tRNA pseudouridine13 synthase